MNKPTLSVIMSNYNHGHYIGEALKAIVGQSFKPLEVIVIDDASTDNSIEIIQQFVKHDSIVHLVKNEQNMGSIYNGIKYLASIHSDYVYFAAADDKVLPCFFEKSMGLMAQYPQAGLCSTLTQCIDEEGRDRGVLHMPVISHKGCFIPPNKALSILHKYGSWIQGNTTILRRRALIDCGGVIPELRSFCDGFIYLVIAVKHGVCFIPEPLATWRQLENSYSATNAMRQDSLQDIRYATKLMRTNYRDVFPPDFVDYWEKREMLNNRLARFSNLQNTSLKDMQYLIPSQSLMDKGLFRLRKLFTKIEYVFFKYYLYRRAGLPANQLFIQRVKSFWRSILK